MENEGNGESKQYHIKIINNNTQNTKYNNIGLLLKLCSLKFKVFGSEDGKWHWIEEYWIEYKSCAVISFAFFEFGFFEGKSVYENVWPEQWT